MTTAYWCVFYAFLLPYIFVVFAKFKAPGMNNEAPREALSKLTGWRQRANWAQQNAFEAFAPFAAAVIIAHLVGAKQNYIDMLSIVFVVCRILHGVFYMLNWPAMRSLVWFVGFFSVIGLFYAI